MTGKTTLFIQSTLALLAIGMASIQSFASSGSFVSTTNQELLPAIRTGLINNLSAIKNGTGEITVTEWHLNDIESNSILKTETKYFVVFSNDRFRLSLDRKIIQNDEEPDSNSNNILPAPGQIDHTDVGYDGQLLTTINGNEAYVKNIRTCACMLNRYRLDTSIISPVIDDLLEALKTTDQPAAKIVGNEIIDGDKCVVLEVASRNSISTGGTHTVTEWFWINESKGFAVSRVRIWEEGGLYKKKTLVSQMNARLRNYGNHIWAPSQITMSEYRINVATGKCYEELENNIFFSSDYALNCRIQPANLDLVIPSGTEVYNEVADTQYKQP